MAKPAKEVPLCTVFLVVAAIACNTMVLSGNIATSHAIRELGESTKGWSQVGISFATAMTGELNHVMSDIAGVLTNAIESIQAVQTTFDSVLGMAGSVAEDFMNRYRDAVAVAQDAQDAVKEKLAETKENLAQQVDAAQDAVEDAQDAVKDKLARHAENLVQQFGPGGNTTGSSSQERADDEIMYLMQAQPQLRQSARRVHHRHEQRLSRHHHVELVLDARSCVLEQQAQPRLDTSDILSNLDDIWGNITGGDASSLSPTEFKARLREALVSVIDELVRTLTDKLDEFFVMIEPALVQVGEWLIKFGDQMGGALSDFSVTLDTVQSIFDQIMEQLSAASQAAPDDEEIRYETFTLFDNNDKGFITVEDIMLTADTYQISSLFGDKGPQLFSTYDANQDGHLTEDEFANFVNDPSIPGIMAVMLRDVADNLVTIAGKLSKAVYRDEVASEIVDYLSVQVAKNMTKVGWVCDTLMNQSLPAAFSADVLKNVAMDDDKAGKLTSVDVGQITVQEMAALDATYFAELMMLLMDPEFWQSEGFDPADQPRVAAKVSQWLVSTPQGAAIVQDISPRLRAEAASREQAQGLPSLSKVPDVFREFTSQRSETFQDGESGNESQVDFYGAGLSQLLRSKILGGVDAASANRDETQKAAVRGGQRAVPATKEFAARLGSNASATADTYQQICFDYTSKSTNAVSSFANTLSEMIKKVQLFTTNMQEFCTPGGIQRMEDMFKQFASQTARDVVDILMDEIDVYLPDGTAGSEEAAQPAAFLDTEKDILGDIANQVHSVVTSLQLMLPAVVDDLKFARKAVADIASPMDTIFNGLLDNGPPIFHQVSDLYRQLWTIYYVVLTIFTTLILFYGFWAAGWCGQTEQEQAKEEEYQPPRTFGERLRCCGSCCLSCCSRCHDNTLAFWSVIMLMELIVLLLFVVTIILCLLAGIKMFIAAGCSSIYLLSDEKVCQGTLSTLKGFVTSFLTDGDVNFETACTDMRLLTCQTLSQDFLRSIIFTMVGSVLAAVCSFQLIVEAAIQHERARWRKAFEEQSRS